MTLTLDHALEELQSAAVALSLHDGSLRPRASALLRRSIALLEEGRLKEGLTVLEQSLELIDTERAPYPPNQAAFLQNVVDWWLTGGALYGVFAGILPAKLYEAEFGAQQCIAAVRFAKRARLNIPRLRTEEMTLDEPVQMTESELRRAAEELNTMIRLLSIEDPFEGALALSEELQKSWPEGVSAVDAIREQRE
jgi:hypothetical protein